jgi:hypothetical protein
LFATIYLTYYKNVYCLLRWFYVYLKNKRHMTCLPTLDFAIWFSLINSPHDIHIQRTLIFFFLFDDSYLVLCLIEHLENYCWSSIMHFGFNRWMMKVVAYPYMKKNQDNTKYKIKKFDLKIKMISLLVKQFSFQILAIVWLLES